MKRLLACTLAALLGGFIFLNAASGASHVLRPSPRAHDAALVAKARAAFNKAMSAHAPAVVPGKWVSPGAKHSGAAGAGNGTVTGLPSINWSGFADSESSSAQRLSRVSGDWTMPGVTCPPKPYENQDAFVAQWVGLDGVTNQTVEQLGTGAQCFEGVLYYYVWYEMYPSGTVEEGTAACVNNNTDCPQPGDQISASVTVTSAGSGEDSYTLALADHTRPDESFSVSQQCAASTCLDSSAEWIVERPAVLPPVGVQILPLADFGQTSFSQASEVSGGRSASIAGFAGGPVYDVAMTDDTDSYYLDCIGQSSPAGSLLLTTDATACPVVTPSGGSSFTATWDSSF